MARSVSMEHQLLKKNSYNILPYHQHTLPPAFCKTYPLHLHEHRIQFVVSNT